VKEALSPSGRLKVTKNINTLEGLALRPPGAGESDKRNRDRAWWRRVLSASLVFH
jgi:hypothetical protein